MQNPDNTNARKTVLDCLSQQFQEMIPHLIDLGVASIEFDICWDNDEDQVASASFNMGDSSGYVTKYSPYSIAYEISSLDFVGWENGRYVFDLSTYELSRTGYTYIPDPDVVYDPYDDPVIINVPQDGV